NSYVCAREIIVRRNCFFMLRMNLKPLCTRRKLPWSYFHFLRGIHMLKNKFILPKIEKLLLTLPFKIQFCLWENIILQCVKSFKIEFHLFVKVRQLSYDKSKFT